MPIEEFIALNPGCSRPLIRASVTPRIVLPADKVDVFHDNLAKLDGDDLVSWKTYYPKKGDTFEAIAKKHRMTVSYLREVNGINPRTKVLPTMVVVPLVVIAGVGRGVESRVGCTCRRLAMAVVAARWAV